MFPVTMTIPNAVQEFCKAVNTGNNKGAIEADWNLHQWAIKILLQMDKELAKTFVESLREAGFQGILLNVLERGGFSPGIDFLVATMEERKKMMQVIAASFTLEDLQEKLQQPEHRLKAQILSSLQSQEGVYDKEIAQKLDVSLSDVQRETKEMEEAIYESLLYYLQLLETGALPEQGLRVVQLSIIWTVIGWSGFQPGVFACANCGEKLTEKDIYWFNISLGLECEKCTSKNLGKKVRISKDTVKVLRLFLTQPAAVISKIVVSPKVVSQLLQVTRMTLEEILGRRVYL